MKKTPYISIIPDSVIFIISNISVFIKGNMERLKSSKYNSVRS
jgi:hypothetical protein